jgi:hypothetical protein
MRCTYLLIFSLAVVSACDEGSSGRRFEGIALRDEMNNPLGTLGTKDLNDWENSGIADKDVKELLEFTDDIGLTGTVVSDIEMSFYPNPARDFGYYMWAAEEGKKVKIKYVIVDEKLNVISQNSHVAEEMNFQVPLNELEPGKIYRIYYSFSAEGHPDFFSGHGDILTCKKDGDCL